MKESHACTHACVFTRGHHACADVELVGLQGGVGVGNRHPEPVHNIHTIYTYTLCVCIHDIYIHITCECVSVCVRARVCACVCMQ